MRDILNALLIYVVGQITIIALGWGLANAYVAFDRRLTNAYVNFMIRREIKRLRWGRMAMLLERRAIRNAARLERELEGAGVTGRGMKGSGKNAVNGRGNA